ncbi:hypothetical protein BJP62_05660 [Jeongeupia sp. USM3]|nr:hypothetical protein BJP62_05660 [Jeongeupia sp. USM3]
MTTNAPEWDDQRVLLAVLREGSLLGAARVLGVSQPTVRRRIEALEAALGVALFTRGTAAVVPTQTALGLLPHLEAMERAAAALQRGASADAGALAGKVRLTTSGLLGVEVLPTLLAPLRANHAGIGIELALSDRLEDLIEHEADIALRTVRPDHDSLVAQRAGITRVGLYGTPELIARHGLPTTLDALGDWPLITPDRSSKDWETLALHGYPVDHVRTAIRTDNHLAQLAAIRAGLGIGPCHHAIAQRDGLVRVLDERFGFDLAVWLAMPESLRNVRRVAVVFRHLVEATTRFLRVSA